MNDFTGGEVLFSLLVLGLIVGILFLVRRSASK
jgi:hypothetical protein